MRRFDFKVGRLVFSAKKSSSDARFCLNFGRLKKLRNNIVQFPTLDKIPTHGKFISRCGVLVIIKPDSTFHEKSH